MKRIILCADDYGQNGAISQAIIHLFKNKRLSATSCMTTSPHWLSEAERLRDVESEVDIGLHFNLTEGWSLSSSTPFDLLGKLIIKSQLRLLNRKQIEVELQYQLDQFEKGLGRMPDFIDGHQHIHHLPVVREAILQVYEQRFPDKICYFRNVVMPIWKQRFPENAQLKRIIIQLCGANAFQAQLIRRDIPHNTSFSGIYDFTYAECYPSIFPHFLQEINEQGLIMCHPGLGFDCQNGDVIAASRQQEYRYLASEQFLMDCELNQIKLGRFNQ